MVTVVYVYHRLLSSEALCYIDGQFASAGEITFVSVKDVRQNLQLNVLHRQAVCVLKGEIFNLSLWFHCILRECWLVLFCQTVRLKSYLFNVLSKLVYVVPHLSHGIAHLHIPDYSISTTWDQFIWTLIKQHLISSFLGSWLSTNIREADTASVRETLSSLPPAE